jgi:hypothetical protein
MHIGGYCDYSCAGNRQLGGHVKRRHPAEFNRQKKIEDEILAKPKVAKRTAWTLADKVRAIVFYFTLVQQLYLRPGAIAAHSLGVPKGTFDPWLADKEELLSLYLTYPGYRKKKRIVVTSGKFAEQEQELYLAFLYRRKILKLPVSQNWLRSQFRKILAESEPEGWDTFRYSRGWVCRFCIRFRICDRAMTNKKTSSVLERLPEIRKFHQYLIYFLPRMCTGPIQCAKYGRFSAYNRYHMDQIPLPFVFESKRTLHLKGESDVPIRHPHGSGLEKRQCTVQLCIRAEGPQHVRPMLIFRGLGQVSRSELDFYAAMTDIVVVWQPKAWADRRVMMDWLDTFSDDIGGDPTTREEVMLGMDQHGPQMVDEFLQGMRENRVYGVYTPVNCTDVAAPIDHHVGARLKEKMKHLYFRDFEENMDRWCYELTAQDRRMKIATWLSEAWADLKQDGRFFRAVFQSTGFCNAMDGSEDHLVKVGDECPGYSVLEGEDIF